MESNSSRGGASKKLLLSRLIESNLVFSIFIVIITVIAATFFIILALRTEPPLSGIVGNPNLAGKGIQKEIPDEVWERWGIQREKISDEENAGVHYEKAGKLFVDFEDFYANLEGSNEYNRLSALKSYVEKYGWTAEAEELIPWIEENIPAMNEILKGAKKPKCSLPVYYDPAKTLVTLNIMMPDLANIIWMANISLAYSSFLESQGKVDESVEIQHAFLKAGLHLASEPFTVNYLVGILIQNIAIKKLERIVFKSTTSPETLRKIRDEAAEIAKRIPSLKKVLLCERASGLAIMTDAYRGYIDLEALGRIDDVEYIHNSPGTWLDRLKRFTARLIYPLSKSKDEIRKFYDRSLELVDMPIHEGLVRQDEVAEEVKSLRQKGSPVVAVIAAMTRILDTNAKAHINLEVLVMRASLELYKRDKGEYPALINELVPDYLSAVPIDAASGKPLHYYREENRYVIWSVGQNLVDDGGSTEGRLEIFDTNRAADYVFTSDVEKPEPFQWPPVDENADGTQTPEQ